MSTATFPSSIGGSGNTYTDDDNADTGLLNGGHLLRFVPALSDVVAAASFTSTAATSALGGANTNSTSTTSLAISTGSKSITLAESGKAYAIGQYVLIAYTTTPSYYMIGQVTAFSGTSLTVDVTTTSDLTSTYATWSITVTGEPFTGNAAPDFLLINAGIR